jgi:SPP1 gp7 family putative phage head morphogenesis protein
MRWIFAPPKKTSADPYAHAMRNRAALLKREREAARQIELLYRAAQGRIEPKLAALVAEIGEAKRLGTAVDAEWLRSQHRFEALLHQIEWQISGLAAGAVKITAASQETNIQRGLFDAHSALDEAAKFAGLDMQFERLPAEALEGLAGFLADGSPLASLFSTFGPEARQAASESLFAGIAQGSAPAAIARDLRADLGVSRDRAMRIARNESMRAYRSAASQERVANADVVAGWAWACSYSVRTCAMCIAMDGTEHAVDEEMASHVECRCTETPILKDAEQQKRTTGPEWFAGLDDEKQDMILGPLKGDLFRSGDITLQDLVKTGTDPVWGDYRAEKSIRDLIKEGTVSNATVADAARASR